MKKKHLIWLKRALTCFTLLCIVMTVYASLEHSSGAASYENAAAIAFSPETLPAETSAPTQPPTETTAPVVRMKWIPGPQDEDAYMTELKEIDLEALREVNPDVVGWIKIPDTKVNYPIMQGEDNDFYLNHTWEKNPNGVGSIFLEHRNNGDFTDFNTIVYGHNMKNGSMFGGLDKYYSEYYQQNHPYIYVVNDAGIFRYEIFACFRVNTDNAVYGLSFNQQQTREKFLAASLEQSVINTGVEPAVTDRILTLSTCTAAGGTTRWVVQARLPMILVEE